MQRMRQNSMSGRWRSAEEAQADRRALATRLGLSEFSSLAGSRSNPDGAFDTDIPGLSLLPAPPSMDHLPFNSGSGRSSFATGTRIGGGCVSHSRGGPRGASQVIHRSSGNLEMSASGPCGVTDGDIDIFHDCMNLEENVTFSNMFDDLDLEGSEVGPGRDEAASSGAFAQPDAVTATMQMGAPSYNPATVTGNSSSRGSSCKRKSCNIPSASGFQDGLSMRHIQDGVGAGHQGVDLSQRPAFMLPPPSGGASSSRSAALMEGPRPQKTRLSSDALDSTLGASLFTSSRMPDFAGLSGTSGNAGSISMHPSQVYPRAVRRTFPPGPDSFRIRRNALLDYSPGPDGAPSHGHLTFSGGSNPRDPGAAMAFSGGSRAARLHGGSSSIGGQGLSRRIARVSSGRSMTASASPREQTESRIRSVSMACLENGTFTTGSNRGPAIRRGVANYLPTLGARHPPISDARQLHGYNGRATFFTHGRTMSPPQVPSSLMEAPEMRPPPPFEGSQTFRHPALAVGRRELSALSEGFMAIPSQELEWDHHRPRLMAGGLAEILQALERVERDEDLTREQLIMLEATTFLFGGIGLHDDHSDWRLDIDNMSYEELLALGDRIGTVSTGLSEDTIVQQLKRTKYAAALARSSEDSDVKCCVCQEEFEEGVELGTINCGHNYHMDCIRQWLVRKNSCPICKATALPQISEPGSPKLQESSS
ncbi:E3 ubiquitin-protein ligase MBR2 [Selaginella moellendorffii]|uniref:E3 ubiquitin-protein ligase MBR2 n=1 Tax=Selaginella moellendorffii TaxID=88036 RepID=UPI000D1CA94A|nr:E3 ubiquitin-protein ligase MBR2 [Selaginella moellendorffii]|eukprot:XP_024520868.1 E3 ubiquitin-protein ligase MBR2 [Selaginella moellendorffii]